MANVMDFASEELARLQLLADDLEEILLVIINDGKAEDRQYVIDAKRRMSLKYGRLMKNLRIDNACFPGDSESGIGKALDGVRTAYKGLQDIFTDKERYDPEFVRQEARDLLYENLVFPDEFIEDFVEGRVNEQTT